jgi:phosphoglycolate phosphatase-like HAD superfamily hydrolase
MTVGLMKYLLLDFDGPVCSVFAGFPAPEVARSLKEFLRADAPSGWMADTDDPHEVLRASMELGPDVAARAHRELSALEVRAVQTAEPTPYAAEVIDRAKSSGSQVAIVSNNAQAAIASYLETTELISGIDYVSARSNADPSLMKPSPYLVTQATAALNADKALAALVGDQISDIMAARRAGVQAVGYANKSGKADSFKRASADLIITSMAELFAHI